MRCSACVGRLCYQTVIKSVRASRGDSRLIVWLYHRFGCVRRCAGWGTEHFTSKLMQAIVTR